MSSTLVKIWALCQILLLRHIVGEFDFDLISCDDDLIYPDSYVDDFLKYKEITQDAS